MVSCILLAAGESRRFGSPKPLASIGHQTVLEYVLNNLARTDIAEIIVVLGSEADRITPHIISDPKIRTTLNKDFILGQTSSFKKGVEAVSPRAAGVLLLPVDVPFVKPGTIDALIKTFKEQKCKILIPAFEGRAGHPPIFDASLKKEFLALNNNEPLSSIQRRHAAETVRYPVTDEGVVLSFNTPQELSVLLRG